MANIYLVNEDNHGMVSCWDTEEKAKKEAVKILNQVYNEKEEIPMDELLDRFSDCVGVEEIELNRSWID